MKIEIQIPIYDRLLTVCDDPKEQPHPELGNGTLGIVWNDGNNVFFTFKRNEEFGGSALAHECLHIAHAVFRICGVNADEYHDEHTAYLLGYLYRVMFDFVFHPEKYKKYKKNS